jgi:hypothetical protein
MTGNSKFVAAVVALGVIAAAYTGYWFYVAAQLESGIGDWVDFQRQNGVEIQVEREKIHGFPFDFRATFRHPTVKAPVNGQIVTWVGADVAARMSPFDLHAVAFSTPGLHVLQGPDGNLYIQAEQLDGRVEIAADGMLTRAVLDLGAAQVKLPNDMELQAASAHAAIGLPSQPPMKYPELLVGFDLWAENVTLPTGTHLLTEGPLIRIAAAGAVRGPMPQAPIDQALTAWRDAGGVVDLKSFAFAQGPLAVTGSATVALDRSLQPEGAASLQAKGLAPTIDLLANQGLISRGDVLKFKAFVLGAQKPGADGQPEVATGLSLQNGILSWGPFPITRVPEIVW